MKKITQINHIVEDNDVFESNQLKDIVDDWITIWKRSRGENSTPMTYKVLQMTFLDRFFHHNMKEAMVNGFMNLR